MTSAYSQMCRSSIRPDLVDTEEVSFRSSRLQLVPPYAEPGGPALGLDPHRGVTMTTWVAILGDHLANQLDGCRQPRIWTDVAARRRVHGAAGEDAHRAECRTECQSVVRAASWPGNRHAGVVGL
jgi:hypothetical protein